MPQRSDKPGLKYRMTVAGRQPYWVAKQVMRDPMGFPDKTIRLPSDATEDELAALCRDHTATLLKWIANVESGIEPEARYDGTVRSLSQLYQRNEESPFHGVRKNTRKTYADSLKVIESTVGARLVARVTVVDVRRWYRLWRAPKAKGGPERIDRAHDAIAMFRTILRFGFALGHDECGKLDERLATQRFEKGSAREQEMTYPQAAAFVRTALDLGGRGIIPEWRGRYMAIGVASQFELALRQKDIIGEWDGDQWAGSFTWENIPGWKLRLRTSKNRAAAVFTLGNYPLLFPLLEAVPHAERIGAIVKGERGLPIRERSYRKWFRAIARAAEIPDEVWSMDSRAGAATEADEAETDLKAISDMLTHADTRTTLRYIRRSEKRIAAAAEARVKSRGETK
jgi:hypothetical protein